MTRDEVLNMKAGVEMDMLVAVHVFGRKAHPNKNKILGRFNRYVSPLHYSMAVVRAYEVEEEIYEKHSLAVFYINNLIEIVMKDDDLNARDWVLYYELAHATAEQKCKAALLAVMKL